MSSQKKLTVQEFFEKNNRDLMIFGKTVLRTLTNKALIASVAEKDLEKLVKVFKLVFELAAENTREDPTEKIAELISLYSTLDEEEEE